MSIKVTIEQHPDGNFRREAIISRISDLDVVGTPTDDQADRVFEYEVTYGQGRANRQPERRATFTHRYGDLLSTIVAKALTALDEKYPEDRF